MPLLIEGLLNVKELAYLFTTYAIEKRAGHLYPLYHDLLKSVSSPVSVKSILLEEEEHLAEIEEELSHVPLSEQHCLAVCALEKELHSKWLTALQKDVFTKGTFHSMPSSVSKSEKLMI